MPDHSDLPDQDLPRGTGTNGRGDPATDLLLAAFDHEVRTQPVDERRLTAGTRARLRHRRRVHRMQVAAAALIVAAAVPVAVQVWPTPTVSITPIGQNPARSVSPAPSTAQPAPTAEQEEPNISVVAYDIPDMTRARSTLPGSEILMGDGGQYRSETPLAGPVGCAGGSADLLNVAEYSVAGRQFQWADETLPQSVVTLQVTGWPTGTGTAMFDDATSGSLTCRMTGELTPVNLTIPGADQSWAVIADLGGPPSYIAGSARVGDLIVSASLPAATTDAATARSEELVTMLTAAVEDLRASGLPAVQGG